MLLVCKVLCGQSGNRTDFSRLCSRILLMFSVMSTLVITVCKPVTDDDLDPIQFKDHLKPLGQKGPCCP
jgi:hypothetical protein